MKTKTNIEPLENKTKEIDKLFCKLTKTTIEICRIQNARINFIQPLKANDVCMVVNHKDEGKIIEISSAHPSSSFNTYFVYALHRKTGLKYLPITLKQLYYKRKNLFKIGEL